MIANDKLPKGLQPPGGGYATPPDLKSVASAFVSLQEARHTADYDLSRTFRRQEALDLVESARQAFQAWERVRRLDDARVYLACFLLWKRWTRTHAEFHRVRPSRPDRRQSECTKPAERGN